MTKITYLFFIFGLLFLPFKAQNLVQINKVKTSTTDTSFDPEAYFTPEELVKKVLIPGGECYEISNVEVFPNINPPTIGEMVDSQRGYGFFKKGNSNFPFEKGIILSSGFATNAGNVFNTSILNDRFSTQPNGDIDLANALNLNVNELFDTNYLKFNFKAIGTKIKFRYFLVSEEYTQDYPCQFTDAFALFIKKASDPNFTNLAVLPDNTTVSTKNIHPTLTCGAAHEEFFDRYNPGSSHFTGSNTDATSNFNGQTKILTAEVDVIPGEIYTFKFVIADNDDNEYDTAVFIDANFDVGFKFTDTAGQDYPSTNGVYYSNSCSDVASIPLVVKGGETTWTYVWSYNSGNGNFVVIPNQNTNQYTATQPGVYRVSYTCSNNFVVTKDFNYIDARIKFTTKNPTIETNCDINNLKYNLHDAEAKISSETGLVYKFYPTQTDATNGTSEIVEPLLSNYLYTVDGATVVAKVTNAAQCFDYATVTLKKRVLLNPTISASSLSFCEGKNVVLTSNMVTGNTWNTGETTQSITISTAGNYTVSIQNGTCIETSPSVNIIKNNLPNLIITNPSISCGPNLDITTSSIVMGSESGLNYTYWSDASATIPISNPTSLDVGTYYIKATNANLCETIKAVEVKKFPQTPISGNTTLCTGGTSQLTTTDTSTIPSPWASSNPLVATISNTGLVQALSLGNTTVSYTNSNGCVQTIEITVNSFPNLIITNPLETCNTAVDITKSDYVLGSDSGLNFTYFSDANATISLPNANTIAISGTYYIKGTNANGCFIVKPIVVKINPIPVLELNPSFTICANKTANIVVIPNTNEVYSYVWTVPPGAINPGNTNNFTTNIAGNYSVIATNSVTNCSSAIYKTSVNVNALPNILSNREKAICDDDFDIIYTENLNSINDLINSNSTNYNFEYYSDAGYSTLIPNPSNANLGNTLPKIIYVKMIDKLTLCEQFTDFTFKASTQITNILKTETIIKNCDTDTSPINDGFINFDLTSVKNEFNTNSATLFKYYKTLTAAQNQTSNDEILNPISYRNTISNSDAVYVRIQESGKCATIGKINLEVLAIPYDSSIIIPPAICNGQTDTVSLQVEDIYSSYAWKDPNGNVISNTNSVSGINISGTYSITLTNANNCPNTQFIEVKSYDLPKITTVNYGNGTIEVVGSEGVPPYEYSFDGGLTWAISNFYTDTNYTNLNFSKVQVAIRNQIASCIGESIEIPFYHFANTFTPNQDNQNETWRLNGLQHFNNVKLSIFDRYGKSVYEFIQKNNQEIIEWDGKLHGMSLPSTSYWYNLSFIDPITSKLYQTNGYIVLKNRLK